MPRFITNGSGWFVLVVTLLSSGCAPRGGGTPGEALVRPAEAWRRELPIELRRIDSPRLPSEQFALVVDSQQESAQLLLEDEPWRALSIEDAASLTGRSLAMPEGGVAVLLRAIYQPCDVPIQMERPFDVVWLGDAVVVRNHTVILRRQMPLERRAVVAALPRLPDDVFVEVYAVRVEEPSGDGKAAK